MVMYLCSNLSETSVGPGTGSVCQPDDVYVPNDLWDCMSKEVVFAGWELGANVSEIFVVVC